MKKTMVLLICMVFVCLCFTGCDREAPALSGIDDLVEIQCGTDFNLKEFLNSSLEISDKISKDETITYKLEELDYDIECDNSIFDNETGEINTEDFGTFKVKVTVSDKSKNKSTLEFDLFLNPLVIEKGYYVYKNDFDDQFSVLGYCEYKNVSGEMLQIDQIKFEYFDKENIKLSDSDMPNSSPKFLKGKTSGYAVDTFASFNMVLDDQDDISSVDVKIDYSKGKDEDSTTLDVGEVTAIHNYQYNVSHFAGEAVVTNPTDKNFEDINFLCGLYDSDNKLIGVMDSMDSVEIDAKSKVKIIACWLPDPKEIPNKVVSIKGIADGIE